MKVQLCHTFEDLASLENLFLAWQEFLVDKKKTKEIILFSRNLIDNIYHLHEDLISLKYTHGGYKRFSICDPKPRIIHKALVRDRLLHHAIYRILYPFFNRTFIADSFSCRVGKGTPPAAIDRLRSFAYKVSKNHTRTCWILKCDIRKFFDNIDQAILLKILSQYILDSNIRWLLEKVIKSFDSGKADIGLPLGNLTSHLFVNIYMNVFDQFVKHKLKAQYYIRYADDFILLSNDKHWLLGELSRIGAFLQAQLGLSLHPNKVILQTFASGVDFLGWINFSDHRVLRTKTRKRMIKRINAHPTEVTIRSYLGLMSHGNSYKLCKRVL